MIGASSYLAKEISVTEEEEEVITSLGEQDIRFQLLSFDSSSHIYSINATLVTEQVVQNDSSGASTVGYCALMFIGTDSRVVLVSNTIR